MKEPTEGTTIDEDSGPGRPKRTRQSKPKGKPTSVTADEAKVSFFNLFRVTGKVVRSRTEFAEKRFANMGKVYADMASQFPALAFVLKLINPLVFVGEFFDAWSEMWAARPQKAAQDEVIDVDYRDVS